MGMMVGVEDPILVEKARSVLTIQFNRPNHKNSINDKLLEALQHTLESAEEDKEVKVIVLKGNEQYFCTGMDFNQVTQAKGTSFRHNPERYFDVLKHFSTCSKTIVSVVVGEANAGGIGFVAASEFVIASQEAAFGLSEALFGLIPACVLPFLIRRVGFQKAQWLTLSTQKIKADQACLIGLADEVTDNTNDALRKQLLRLTRLDVRTIKQLKTYMEKLWEISDQTRELATTTTTQLFESEQVKSGIENYINTGEFPWNRE